MAARLRWVGWSMLLASGGRPAGVAERAGAGPSPKAGRLLYLIYPPWGRPGFDGAHVTVRIASRDSRPFSLNGLEHKQMPSLKWLWPPS